MGFDKLTPLGDSGSLENETTFEDWVADGFVDERVRYTRLNRQFNRGDSKINETIDHVKLTPDAVGSTPYERGLWTSADCMHAPDCDENILGSYGAAKRYHALDYVKISGEKKLLVADYDAANLDVFDISSMTLESANDLSAGLDTSGTQDWCSVDVCNDGTYCYVLFVDLDASPRTYCVQSYALSSMAPNPSWPATGLDLTGSGSFTLFDGLPQIIYAATDKLAVLQRWVTITAGTSAAVGIIDATDGTLDGEGAGGVTLTSSTTAHGLASDGTNVYFGVRDTSANDVQLVSMPIASPGGSGMYATLTGLDDIDDGSTYVGSLCCAGNQIVMGFKDDTSNVRAVCFVTDGTNLRISSSLITSGSSDLEEVYNIVFDGLHFWALGKFDTAVGDTSKIVRLDFVRQGSRAGAVSDPWRPPVQEMGYTLWDINPNPNGDTGPDSIYNHMVHDGRDLWVVWDVFTGDGRGRILRFPKTGLR